jgi:hypothetical protein
MLPNENQGDHESRRHDERTHTTPYGRTCSRDIHPSV